MPLSYIIRPEGLKELVVNPKLLLLENMLDITKLRNLIKKKAKVLWDSIIFKVKGTEIEDKLDISTVYNTALNKKFQFLPLYLKRADTGKIPL